MMNPRTSETEMLDVALTTLTRARHVNVSEVRSAQDAMLNLHIDWEALQSRLRSRTVDGFEPVVDSMLTLASTALAMAAALQAKILNQRMKQLEKDAVDSVNEFAASQLGKQRKRKLVKNESTVVHTRARKKSRRG